MKWKSIGLINFIRAKRIKLKAYIRNHRHIKKVYNYGETRRIKKFIFFPKCIRDEWRCLGVYEFEQRYDSMFNYSGGKWKDHMWID